MQCKGCWEWIWWAVVLQKSLIQTSLLLYVAFQSNLLNKGLIDMSFHFLFCSREAYLDCAGTNELIMNQARETLQRLPSVPEQYLLNKGLVDARVWGLPFTHEQMFWIVRGRTTCSAYTDAGMKQQLLTGPHAPWTERAIEPLKNLKEFARDFGCSPESNMVRENICKVW